MCAKCRRGGSNITLYYHPSGRALCETCYPFTCARCGTTEVWYWVVFPTEQWCDLCYLDLTENTFEEKSDGKLFT
jgi:hypothetical protein